MEPMKMKDFVRAIVDDLGFPEIQINFQVGRHSFDYHEQTISLYPHRVYRQAEQMNLELTTYLLFSVTHAIGQHIVFKQGEWFTQPHKRLRAAWLQSRPLIPPHFIESYNQFNKNLLNNLKGKFDNDQRTKTR